MIRNRMVKFAVILTCIFAGGVYFFLAMNKENYSPYTDPNCKQVQGAIVCEPAKEETAEALEQSYLQTLSRENEQNARVENVLGANDISLWDELLGDYELNLILAGKELERKKVKTATAVNASPGNARIECNDDRRYRNQPTDYELYLAVYRNDPQEKLQISCLFSISGLDPLNKDCSSGIADIAVKIGKVVPYAYWLTKAAEGGLADAQYALAHNYAYNNYTFSQNYDRAFRWATKASDQGNMDAKILLAKLYMGEHDFVKVAELYSETAEMGDGPSQEALGWMYLRGQGVPQNFVEGYKWFLLAKYDRQNHADKYKECGLYPPYHYDLPPPPWKVLDDSYDSNWRASATPEQIAEYDRLMIEADRLAKMWKPKPER